MIGILKTIALTGVVCSLGAVLGAGIAGQAGTSRGVNSTVVSAISPAGVTATVGPAGWHQYPGEDGVDEFVPQASAAWFDIQASSNYLYWTSGDYGLEGGNGTSTCNGKLYQILYSNGGVWTAALIDNIVHLVPKAANSFGSVNPYQRILSPAGTVANTQSCAYAVYHFHHSRGTSWGNGARTIAGYSGQLVGTSDVIFVGRD